jgi:hypothetical protein
MAGSALDNIKELRGVEENIYGELNRNSGKIENEDREQRLKQLKTLSTARNSLFNDLVEKSDTLSDLKSNRNELKTLVDGKKRMVEINTYYGKQYNAHTNVVLLLLYTFIAILVLVFLRNRGFLNTFMTNILVFIVMVIGALIVYYRISDLSNRDDMDYDKYNWPGISNDGKSLNDYVPPPSPVGGESNDGDDSCVGEKCCGYNTIYSKTFDKCIYLVNKSDGASNATNETNETDAADASDAAPIEESFTLLSSKACATVKPFSESISFETI